MNQKLFILAKAFTNAWYMETHRFPDFGDTDNIYACFSWTEEDFDHLVFTHRVDFDKFMDRVYDYLVKNKRDCFSE